MYALSAPVFSRDDRAMIAGECMLLWCFTLNDGDKQIVVLAAVDAARFRPLNI